MSKKYYIVFLPLLIALLITAGVVRSSYTNIGQKYYDYPYSAVYSDNDKDNILSMNNYSEFSDILTKSDLIVECKVLPGRKITDIAFYTPVKVIAVYKGGKNLVSQQLNIIENVRIRFDKKALYGYSGYIPLQENNEYILCLTRKQWNSSKRLSEYDRSQYYVTSNSAFGVFRTNSNKQTELFSLSPSNTTINTLKEIDIMTDNQTILNQYYDLKDELFKAYNVT